jgi:hypothetical protein
MCSVPQVKRLSPDESQWFYLYSPKNGWQLCQAVHSTDPALLAHRTPEYPSCESIARRPLDALSL